jgi:hypothetical protein
MEIGKKGRETEEANLENPIICPTSPNENPESNQGPRLKRLQVKVKTKQIPKLPCLQQLPSSSESAGFLVGSLYLNSEVLKAVVHPANPR